MPQSWWSKSNVVLWFMIFLKKLLYYLILLCIVSQLACVFEYSDPVAQFSYSRMQETFHFIICSQQYIKQDTTDAYLCCFLMPWSILRFWAIWLFIMCRFRLVEGKHPNPHLSVYFIPLSIFVCKSQYIFLKAVFSNIVFSHELSQKSLWVSYFWVWLYTVLRFLFCKCMQINECFIN